MEKHFKLIVFMFLQKINKHQKQTTTSYIKFLLLNDSFSPFINKSNCLWPSFVFVTHDFFNRIWKIFKKTTQLKLKVSEQPSYSPDLASRPFYLFSKVKSVFKATRSESIEDVKDKAEYNMKKSPATVWTNKKILWGFSKIELSVY